MSYSTVMVHLDLAQSNDTRLRIAGNLAESFKSRLVGIAAADVQPPYFMMGAAAQSALEADRASLESQFSDCEAEFRRVLGAFAGELEWRSALQPPIDFVALNARAADLIVTGGYAGHSDVNRIINPGDLALRAGRPVLMVPSQVEWLKLDNIVVAWKDTREARRAVNDALPLLHKARHVIVVEFLETGDRQSLAKSSVVDVADWLVRRGVSASSIATKALIGVTGRLSVLARDEGANVIVAGAYGHARFNEWIFGGVTRDLLMQQQCCVLLSH
jgi:nucleotide-binding universal stress UspA family protein